jgi:redox-sensitive bicupin YhaK (pirin superfamily)
MLTLRPGNARGHADHGWLDSRHTFSFADYYDPKHMGFRNLRVINEDQVAGGAGFPAHGHRDMEIVSYVLGGGLEHKDSLGTGSVIRPGDVQRMTAGTGVRHSEYNASKTEPVHFFQIWILPKRAGLAPGYEQKAFSDADKRGRLRIVAAPDGRDGSVTLNADALIYAGLFGSGESAALELAAQRHAWVQVARGSVTVNGTVLGAGDGAAVSAEAQLSIVHAGGAELAEVLVFDLA